MGDKVRTNSEQAIFERERNEPHEFEVTSIFDSEGEAHARQEGKEAGVLLETIKEAGKSPDEKED
jgi:hypothetical protein